MLQTQMQLFTLAVRERRSPPALCLRKRQYVVVFGWWLLSCCFLGGQGTRLTAQVWSESRSGQVVPIQVPKINLPAPAVESSIHISAGQIERWSQGQYEVLQCTDQVALSQGNRTLTASQAVVWLDREFDPQASTKKVIVYLEGAVSVEQKQLRVVENSATDAVLDERLLGKVADEIWFGRLFTVSDIHVNQAVEEISIENAGEVWSRAQHAWQNEHAQLQAESDFIRNTQFAQDADSFMNQPILVSPQTGQMVVQPPIPQQAPSPTLPSYPSDEFRPLEGHQTFGSASFQESVMQQPYTTYQATGERGPIESTRVRITPRQSTATSGVRAQPSGIPGETIITATGGVRVLIDSDEIRQIEGFGQPSTSQIVIEADSVVAWTNQLSGVAAAGETAKWEIYLEGNVEFVMGKRIVFAERMFYDATNRVGTILDVEMLTPVENYRGLARLKAEVIQQNGDNNFQAYGAALTSSRLGVPRYWLQSQHLDISRTERFASSGLFGANQIDPATGQLQTEDEYFVESRNNRVYVGGLPVFYWPVIRTSLNNPVYYIKRIRLGNDRVFGNQFIVGLDLFQVLGIREPRNTSWIGDIGYLQERGPVIGSEYTYQWDSFFGIPGYVEGRLLTWFVNDSGLDNLGRGRRKVPLEEDFRGRILWNHQHLFSPGYRLQAELGYLSDRNFLEQYFERDWDTAKDYDTGITLLRNIDNQSFQLSASARINDFFTQTNWLPRFDHHIIGQSVFGTNLIWHAHSHIGYGQFKVAETPINPIDLAQFTLLDWESAEAEGVRLGTRQELDLPIQVGAVRVTPYVLGDITHWGEDLTGNDLTRLFGQTGVRTSLPMWRVDPTIHSVLFNLNGLAHKVTFDSELLFADSNRDLGLLPLYDPLNDDSQEAFQRRFVTNLYGGALPPKYDERFYAIRSALQSNVSSPSAEMVDDLAIVKLGMRNRLQTKRGLPGEARIVDWIEFDIEGSYFPNANRDNFGSDFGMLNYDFAWHVGDRLSVVSDGYFDLFGQGLRTTSLGFFATRPGNGDLFVGVRSIEGPISSNILTTNLTYRMSDKWIVRGGSSIDFGAAGNIGQSLNFIRVGESFLLRFGFNVNSSRNNVGFIFGIEPRFLPRGRLGTVGRQPILPASATYLE